MRVLCVQTPRMPLEKASCYLSDLKKEISDLDFDLVVLPEKWITTPIRTDMELWDDILEKFERVSSDHNATVIPGSFSIEKEEKLFNSAPVITEGKLQGFQDKISLYKIENGKYQSGNKISVFSFGKLKFSVPVCYDLDFPYFAKISVDKGAQFLVNPSLIASEFIEMWHIYVKGRSLENRLPVISVNSLSDPFLGNTIVTHMTPRNGGIILDAQVMGTEHYKVIETNSDELQEYVRLRRQEDLGTYSFHLNGS